MLGLMVSKSEAQSHPDFVSYINTQHAWVDSVYKKLSKKERIAQLFMVRAHTNLGQAYIDSVAQVIKKEHLGGVVLFQGGPVRHARVINRYQGVANVPLLIALDGEWGLGMRLADSTISYPYQMTLGAIQDESLIYQMGREIAKDFKRLGLNVNFAPVVDVNNNPRNPVINYRSFGENKYNVARKGAQYMQGMTDEGIISSLKHFPGHGDTDVDSHKDLPVLAFDRARLDSLEMYPFRELIKGGAPGVMVAHMNIPSLDATPNLPSSLSSKVISGILKKELGFRGITFTDAMDMNGVVKYFKGGEADVRAIIAGNDVLELSQNSKRAVKMVRKAIRKKRIDAEDVEQRVKKVLAAKLWLGLDKWDSVSTRNLYADLHRPYAMRLNQRLADAAVTLLNGDSLIRNLDLTKKTAIISIGSEKITPFQELINTRLDNGVNFLIPNNASADDVSKVAAELRTFDQVLVALHDTRLRPGSILNYNNTVKLFVSEIASTQAIFCVFGNAYALASLPGIEHAASVLLAYQNDETLQRAATKVLFREIKAEGKLPVTVNAFFRYGDGL